MDNRKQVLVTSIIDFLKNEINRSSLNEDKKESVEVAIQCLETAYEIPTDESDFPIVDLLSFIPEGLPQRRIVTEQQKKAAEEYKCCGNNAMKNSQYQEALVAYNKAIELNPNNAVFFCNRAAVFSRLEKHLEVIKDCKEAIKLDPTYGKAYGRLGIAYSNLGMVEDARKAYKTALQYDPTNAMYESNLKLAEEKLTQQTPADNSLFDISQIMNNPALIGLATQMLGDPTFRNLMSGLMNNTENPNFEALFQAGHTLANRMQEVDPNLVDNLRRTVAQPPSASENPPKPDGNPPNPPSA